MELKKNPKLDYRKKSVLFFNIGLVLSLSLVISAFEWKFVEHVSIVDFDHQEPIDELIDVQITDQPPPPKPQMKQIQLIEVPNDEEIEVEDMKYIIDIAEVDRIEDIIPDLGEPENEKAEEIPYFVETMPSFEGGLSEFYKYVSKNLKYPAQARRMQIEGKVFVHFIIDTDGSLSDINVVRGIGAGCDEEVLRIVGKSPKWTPGKQRGVPVKVRMMLPITFRLE